MQQAHPQAHERQGGGGGGRRAPHRPPRRVAHPPLQELPQPLLVVRLQLQLLRQHHLRRFGAHGRVIPQELPACHCDGVI